MADGGDEHPAARVARMWAVENEASSRIRHVVDVAHQCGPAGFGIAASCSVCRRVGWRGMYVVRWDLRRIFSVGEIGKLAVGVMC